MRMFIMGKHNASVYVKNNTGEPITNIQYMHRYDSDVYNRGQMWPWKIKPVP
jgi:hypothetical protein